MKEPLDLQMYPSKNHCLQEHQHFGKPLDLIATPPNVENVFSTEALELSLRLNLDTWRKGIDGYPWEDKCVSSTYGGDLICTHPNHRYFTKPELESSCSRKNDAFNSVSKFHWFTGDSPNYPEKRDLNRGIEQCNGDLSSNSFEDVEQLDLNKALPDYLQPSDQWISNPSTSSSSSQTKQEFEEPDVMVKMGAVSLLDFSLARNTEDCSFKAGKAKGICNVATDVPQTSSESYESIVLKQPYCSADEYCVSSIPFQVSCSYEKDYGLKFKRGRRMKDFRKEVLPGLASLSRHEICEDVKIMELALRSREYKKYRPKTTTDTSPCLSVKSRKPRYTSMNRR